MIDPRLPPGQQWAAPTKWPVVGEREPAASPEPWRIVVEGAVRRPLSLALDALRSLPAAQLRLDIHCVTRWSKADVLFSGVLLADLLALAEPGGAARFVRFVARSTHQHSTSLPLAEALAAGTLLAVAADDRPLAVEHGGPLRVVAPGRYFYKSLKWLTRIELAAEDRLGYWEANAGYHNGADPWQEQRFLAPGISPAQAREILAGRVLAPGGDYRGLCADGLRLEGLAAKRALLRDASFRRCHLSGADFEGANLSNARLCDAVLRGASFRDADLEGADFSGADLRGADFRGASLTATTFATPGQPPLESLVDSTTLWAGAAIDDLMPEQKAFLLAAIERARQQPRQ